MARTLYPLRRIVREFYEAGLEREELECGHVVSRKQDIYGGTNAARRRCFLCPPVVRADDTTEEPR